MPVLKCPNGKYRIGSGPCMYDTKEKAERAYAAYRAKEHSENEEVVNVPYPNEHALRLQEPGKFDEKSFRRTHGSGKGQVQGVKVPASIDVIWGKVDGEGPIPQALRFPVSKWGRDPAKAKKWISDHEVKGTFDAAEAGKEENERIPPDNNDLHVFLVQATNEQYRYETWQGQRQLVVPVVGLVEGVHNGIFYPGEEIANYVEAWNGVPVPVYHPKDMESGVPVSCNDPMIVETQCVGRLWNVEFDAQGAKMKGEIWIDVAKANELNSSIVTTILNGGKMEVSTGLWGDHISQSGEWNGEPYEYVLRNYRPDHLALLPGGEGACNWEDGCGIRVNHVANKEVQMPQKDPGKGKSAREPLKGDVTLIVTLAQKMKVAEASHEDIRRALQDMLSGLIKPQTPTAALAEAYVREVYDNYFIFEAAVADGGTKLFKQAYNVADDGVTLEGEPAEVELKTEYVEMTKKQGKEVTGGPSASVNKQKGQEVSNMDKKKLLVDFLIANENITYGEEDREHLMAMDEKDLEKIKTTLESLTAAAKKDPAEPAPKAEPKAEPAAKAEPEPTTNAAPKAEPAKEPAKEPVVKEEPKPKTPDEFIANAPDEMKEVLTAGLKMHRDKKDKLVKALLANKRNKFTEEQLRAKKMDELEALVELAAVEVDYTGNRSAQHSEPKLNERHEDGTGIPDMPAPVWVNGKPDFSKLQ